MRANANLGPVEHPVRTDVTVIAPSDMPGFYMCQDDQGVFRNLHEHQLDMAKNDIESVYTRLGTRIAELRAKNGLYQREVADELGMTRSNYAMIEQGRLRLPIHQIPLIAKTLNCKPMDLLKGIIIKKGK